LHVIALLVFWVTSVVSADRPVKHEDYTHRPDPPLVRYCIARQCHCGTEPRICDQDGGDATCEKCPPGTFQPHTISTTEIVSGRQCKPHKTCSRGWWMVIYLICDVFFFFFSLFLLSILLWPLALILAAFVYVWIILTYILSRTVFHGA